MHEMIQRFFTKLNANIKNGALHHTYCIMQRTICE